MSRGNVTDLLRDLDQLAPPEQWAEIAGRAAPNRHDGIDGAAEVLPFAPVFDDVERGAGGRKWRPLLWAAAAAVVAILVGVAILQSDDGEDETDIVNQPEEVGLPDPDGTAPETTTTTTTTVPVDPWAFDITYIDVDAGNPVAANDEFAWVAGTEESVLSKIDLATNEVVSTSEIPAGAGTVNFGFGSVWINHSNGTVSRFDPATEAIVATIEVGGALAWIEPGFDSVWLSAREANQVVRVDPETNLILARIAVPHEARSVGENVSGVWVNDGAGLVSRIDPATNSVVATIELEQSRGMMVSPEAVWTPGGDTGRVFRIDPETNAVGAEIDLNEHFGVSVEARGVHFAGGTVWVRYFHDCVEGGCTEGVVRIDSGTNEVVASAELSADWPRGGMSAGPTTAWTFGDTAIARFDFETSESGSE